MFLAIFYLWYIHEPVSPVGLMQIMFLGVLFNFGEVELRSVPTTDAVVGPKVPLNGVVVGLGLVPF